MLKNNTATLAIHSNMISIADYKNIHVTPPDPIVIAASSWLDFTLTESPASAEGSHDE